jgi:glutathione synthase/RimK-type ligase-like ATP-grasp enzyme
MKLCAVLSMDCLEDFEAYDHLFEPHLLELGWKVDVISWRANNISWDNYDAVIIRTPWDYQEDAPAFLQVLENIEQSSAHLENSLAIVRWNIDKVYLKTLEKLSVNLVPTLWRDSLKSSVETKNNITEDDLNQYFEHFSQEQIVFKPRISANADNTFWLTKSNAVQSLSEMNAAFAERDFMIQPFMEHILSEGEFSLFYFNGEYSHAILKTPKDNDFRVQEEHGGRLTTIEPEASLVEHANQCMNAISQLHQTPLYARVDFVRHLNGFALMEAELIEPSLYFNMDDQSPLRFAQAFAKRMNKLAL